MNLFIGFYIISQIIIKGEILPQKESYYLGEPISFKLILKNIDKKKWRIHPPYLFSNLLVIIYREGKRLRLPKECVLPFILIPARPETWEEWAPIILSPNDSFITYLNFATLFKEHYIWKPGKYFLEKIIYYMPPHEKPIPVLSIPVWIDTLVLNINKEIIVIEPQGKLKEIYDKWVEVRDTILYSSNPSKRKNFSPYLDVLKICPDTCAYFPNILYECLGKIEPKRYWLKKFLNTYLYHPFVEGFINDYEWIKKMILPYGKEFIDSLPDEIKNEIYKTLEKK